MNTCSPFKATVQVYIFDMGKIDDCAHSIDMFCLKQCGGQTYRFWCVWLGAPIIGLGFVLLVMSQPIIAIILIAIIAGTLGGGKICMNMHAKKAAIAQREAQIKAERDEQKLAKAQAEEEVRKRWGGEPSAQDTEVGRHPI